MKFTSVKAALEQGIGAYKSGYYQIAEPALKYAADAGEFFGQYYLARIYGDESGSQTNHAAAYQLYLRIVEENANADPDDDQRAPYVGKALTAVARYTQQGLPQHGLAPNPERAAKFLREAATFFRDADAQFELAKMHLKGEGVVQDRRLAIHWLSTLTQEGHAGAQAFLADLLWRGKELPREEVRALALSAVAVANAPETDRIWIEDIYQNIYCGSSAATRQQAEALVPGWRRMYARRSGADESEPVSFGLAARSCSNGEVVPLPGRDAHAPDRLRTETDGRAAMRNPTALQGNASGFGLREIGVPQR